MKATRVLIALLSIALIGCGSDNKREEDNPFNYDGYYNNGFNNGNGGQGYYGSNAQEQELNNFINSVPCVDGQPRLGFRGYAAPNFQGSVLSGPLSPNPMGSGNVTNVLFGFNYDNYDIVAIREISQGGGPAFYEVHTMVCQTDPYYGPRFSNQALFLATAVDFAELDFETGYTLGFIDFGVILFEVNDPFSGLYDLLSTEVARPPL